MKKTAGLFLVFALLFSLAPSALAESGPAFPEPYEEEAVPLAETPPEEAPPEEPPPAAGPKVFYSLEKLGPLAGGAGGSLWYFSTGGKKWQVITVEPEQEAYIDLSKVFGKKDADFQLRRADLAAGGIPPAPPETSSLALEGTLKARPVFSKEITLTAFISEENPLNWTLTGAEEALEFTSGGKEWTAFDAAAGLPLLTAEEQALKLKPVSYLFRVAASEDGGVPPSAPKKINQPKQVKAPSAKPDYKRETLKLKAGLQYGFGKADRPLGEIVFTVAGGEPVSVEDAINRGDTVYLYAPENGKKSRSAVQTIPLAPRGDSPDQGEGLILNKGSVSLQKNYEYYGGGEKWGPFTKGDEKGLVRRKATAKYNPKTKTNTGSAASGAVRYTVRYAEDGKALSVEREPKAAIPLQSWGLSRLEGGSADYGSFSGSQNGARIALHSPNGAVSFVIAPSLAPEDAALADSITVFHKEKEIAPESGSYALSSLKAGDTVTLTVVPKDKNTYDRTSAVITVVMPPENPPGSVSFGHTGALGEVTVTLSEEVRFGQTRALIVDLVRMPEGKVLHTAQTAVSYSPAFYDRVDFDLRKPLLDAGPGSYELRAYFKGTAESSDSVPATAEITLDAEDFGVRFIEIAVPDTIYVGSEITVASLKDGLGNEIENPAYQWYRVSGSARSAISQDGGKAAYTPVQADAWFFLEVLIYHNKTYFSYTVNRQVMP